VKTRVPIQTESRVFHQFVLVCVSLKEKGRSDYRLLESLSKKKSVQRKTVGFWFCSFFLRQFFVRSKTKFLMFCLLLLQTRILFQNHVVVSPFRLLTNGSK
jgi:hypothetical protein